MNPTTTDSMAASGSTLGAALQAFAGLAIVIGLIVAAAYLLKRLQPGRFAGSALLKPVATLSLGARERVVVVEMGEQWLVLGVTAQSITSLHTAAKGSIPTPASPTSAPFAQTLSSFLARSKDNAKS